MKTSLLIALFLSLSVLSAKSQDLPNPPANLQTLPAGSFVIPMDNSLQASDQVPGVYGKFNLKAYGLIVHLLNNYVRVKWVIRAGKAKEDADFTTPAEMIMPSFIAATSRSFLSGPFVIFTNDTAGVRSLTNAYYASQGLSGNKRPNIFRTTTATTVDLRYSLTNFIPKAAVLNDGGNANIHRDYFIASGITTQNYTAENRLAINLNSCYTFASEPHNSKTGAEIDSTVKYIRQFVLSGRNFLAQCAAVRTYENSIFGRFQTTLGFNDENVAVGTNLLYPYPDLSFYQINGIYNASSGGSLKNWKLATGSVTNSGFNKVISAVDTLTQAITMSKLVSGVGGLVFYIGNHDFTDNNEAGINGIRMYMNAFLTPAQPAAGCGSNLPVKLVSFQGNMFNNMVKLQWNVAENENVNNFEVEKSIDGTNFTSASLVFSTEKSGAENYQVSDNVTTEKVFYRLKMTDKSGVVVYSKILIFRNSSITDNEIQIIGNPVKDILTLSFQSTVNQVINISVTDMMGRQVMLQKINSYKGDNLATLPIPATLNNGMYVVDLFDGAGHRSAKFVKN